MSNACSDAIERIYPFLDGELTWVHRVKIRWHLRNCPPCADLYGFEEKLKVAVREGAAEDVPDEVVDRLRSFLRSNDCDCD